MRKTSKVFWIALVVVAMLACTVLGAMASDTSTAVVYGDVVDVSGESTFDVSFKFKENNTDVECGKITLSWDSTKMTATNIVAGAALEGADFGSKINDDGKSAVIAWAGSSIEDNDTDGTLFTVTFDKVAIANGDIAAIDVSVDNFGYVNAFTAVDLAADVAANKAYATGGDSFVWDDTQTDAVAFLKNALIAAQAGNVTVTLKKDMVFTATSKWQVIEIKTDSIPTNTITVTSENSQFGLVFETEPTVALYGQFVFDGITYKGDNTINSNGLFFPDGCHGTFGHAIKDEGASEYTYGGIATTSGKLANIGGNCTVYSGTYRTVAGNLYKNSKITINAPELTLRGNASANYFLGGSMNGYSTVEGVSEVKLLDGATVTDTIAGGGWYCNQIGTAGANVYINTTSTVVYAVAGQVGSLQEASTFNMTIDNGTIDYVVGFRVNNAEGVFKKVTTNITVNNAIVKKAYYGGMFTNFGGYKNTADETCTFNSVINGGSFDKFTVYGGSKMISTIEAIHAAKTTLTVTGGTFASTVAGGSSVGSKGIHSGYTETIIQGVDGREITINGHLFGASSISSGGVHSGDSKLYLKDLSTTTYSFATTSITKNFSVASQLVAGSGVGAGAEHSGNSELIVRRCYMGKILNGGSRIDGKTAVHSGTSKLTIDGKTGYDSVNKVETPTGGWNYISVKVYGGSYFNGYYVENSVQGKASQVRQTGMSTVELIGPEGIDTAISSADYDCDRLYMNAYIFGGSRLNCISSTQENVICPQAHDSEIIVKGWVDAPNWAFGGSDYDIGTVYDNSLLGDVTPNSRVIVEGTFTGNVCGGSYLPTTTTAGLKTVFKLNSGIVLKNNGTVLHDVYLGSKSDKNVNDSCVLSQDGDLLLEIVADGVDVYDVTLSAFNHSYLAPQTSGHIRVVKLVGDPGRFKDTADDEDTSFTVKYNQSWKFDYFDFSQNPTCNVGVKNSTGNGYNTYWERVFYDVPSNTWKTNVEFATSDSTKTSVTQIEAKPDMSVDSFLGTEGMNIYYYRYGADNSTKYNQGFVKYDLFTRLDGVSTSPNAFEFYLADANGKATGEKLEKIPADASQKLVIKSGSVYSAPINLRHVFRVNGASAALKSDISLIFKVNPALMSTYNYSDIKLVVDGTAYDAELVLNEETNVYEVEFEDIAPHMFNDKSVITISAKYGDVNVSSQPVTYSVADYCYSMLGKTDDAALKTLLVDILNYGAAAQTKMVHNTEALANAKLTAEQVALGTQNYEACNAAKTTIKPLEGATVTYNGATLILDNKINVRYNIQLPEGANIADYKAQIKLAGTTWTIYGSDAEHVVANTETAENANDYYVYFDKLTPDQFAEVMEVTIYKGADEVSETIGYSVAAYATKNQDDADWGALVKAMINYCRATKAYVAPAQA